MLHNVVVVQIVKRKRRRIGRTPVSFDSPHEQTCDERNIAVESSAQSGNSGLQVNILSVMWEEAVVC